MCTFCQDKSFEDNVRDLYMSENLRIYNTKRHRVANSKKWILKWAKHAKHQDTIIKRLQHELQQKEIELRQAIENVRTSTYRQYIKVYAPYDYDAARDRICYQGTAKWTNCILWELTTNADCMIWTGFTKKKIIDQSEIAKVHPEVIFHTRHRMYRYSCIDEQAQKFGRSPSTIKKWIDIGLKRMDEYYAKPKLVHGQTNVPQYWNRDRIRANTPAFVTSLRRIKPSQDKVVLSCDGTYQYTLTIQTHHESRKKTTSGHKKRANVIKPHLFCCTNGQPVHVFFTFSDGEHSDGHIFETCMNEHWVLKQRKKLLNNEHSGLIDVETCDELLNLQKLITIHDDIICDNGYQLNDPRLKFPRRVPHSGDAGDMVMRLAAAWKRSITAIRNTHERVNRWIKRNKFCDSVISVEDIWRVPMVWRICMADMVHEDVILMRDNELSERLTAKLLDMTCCAINPADAYFSHPAVRSVLIRANRDSQKNKVNNDDKIEEDENNNEESSSSESDDENNNGTKNKKKKRKKTSTEWTIMAEGWKAVAQWIREGPLSQLLRDTTKKDFFEYIGNQFRRNLAKSYLKRLYLNFSDFRLLQHKLNEWVFMFQNCRSKWRSGKTWNVLFNFAQILWWQSSISIFYHEQPRIPLPLDERHWLQ